MKFLLAALILASACGEAPPSGRWVDSEAAANLVLGVYLGRQAKPHELPRVYAVKSEARCDGQLGASWTYGFWSIDHCVAGTRIGRDVYVVEPKGDTWSENDSFAHEMLHVAGKDHPGAGTWATDSSEAKLVSVAQLALLFDPDADRVR